MSLIPANQARIGDRIHLGNTDAVITHITLDYPTPGRVLLTDTAGRSYGIGNNVRIHITKEHTP